LARCSITASAANETRSIGALIENAGHFGNQIFASGRVNNGRRDVKGALSPGYRVEADSEEN
jgi:hypothetical protein